MSAAFDFLKKLQAEYVASFDEKSRDLLQAIQAKDWEGLRNLLHKLAGSGKTYQFDGISETAKKLELHLESAKTLTTEAESGTLELIELFNKIKASR